MVVRPVAETGVALCMMYMGAVRTKSMGSSILRISHWFSAERYFDSQGLVDGMILVADDPPEICELISSRTLDQATASNGGVASE